MSPLGWNEERVTTNLICTVSLCFFLIAAQEETIANKNLRNRFNASSFYTTRVVKTSFPGPDKQKYPRIARSPNIKEKVFQNMKGRKNRIAKRNFQFRGKWECVEW